MQRIDVDRLMPIAAEAFARHGFSGVGMREVSRECGVSLPTLYYYFGSKEKLFEAVCDDQYQRSLKHIQQGLESVSSLESSLEPSLDRQMEALGGLLFDLFTRDQTLFLLLRRDLIQGSQSQNDLHSRLYYDGMMKILRRLLTQRFDADRADRLGFTVAAVIFGYCEFVMITHASPQLLQQQRQDLISALKALLR